MSNSGIKSSHPKFCKTNTQSLF